MQLLRPHRELLPPTNTSCDEANFGETFRIVHPAHSASPQAPESLRKVLTFSLSSRWVTSEVTRHADSLSEARSEGQQHPTSSAANKLLAP